MKRILAFLLVLCASVALLAVPALADNDAYLTVDGESAVNIGLQPETAKTLTLTATLELAEAGEAVTYAETAAVVAKAGNANATKLQTGEEVEGLTATLSSITVGAGKTKASGTLTVKATADLAEGNYTATIEKLTDEDEAELTLKEALVLNITVAEDTLALDLSGAKAFIETGKYNTQVTDNAEKLVSLTLLGGNGTYNLAVTSKKSGTEVEGAFVLMTAKLNDDGDVATSEGAPVADSQLKKLTVKNGIAVATNLILQVGSSAIEKGTYTITFSATTADGDTTLEASDKITVVVGGALEAVDPDNADNTYVTIPAGTSGKIQLNLTAAADGAYTATATPSDTSAVTVATIADFTAEGGDDDTSYTTTANVTMDADADGIYTITFAAFDADKNQVGTATASVITGSTLTVNGKTTASETILTPVTENVTATFDLTLTVADSASTYTVIPSIVDESGSESTYVTADNLSIVAGETEELTVIATPGTEAGAYTITFTVEDSNEDAVTLSASPTLTLTVADGVISMDQEVVYIESAANAKKTGTASFTIIAPADTYNVRGSSSTEGITVADVENLDKTSNTTNLRGTATISAAKGTEDGDYTVTFVLENKEGWELATVEQTVHVGAALSASPESVTLAAGGSQEITLTLGGAADAKYEVTASADTTELTIEDATISKGTKKTTTTITASDSIEDGTYTVTYTVKVGDNEYTAPVTVTVGTTPTTTLSITGEDAISFTVGQGSGQETYTTDPTVAAVWTVEVVSGSFDVELSTGTTSADATTVTVTASEATTGSFTLTATSDDETATKTVTVTVTEDEATAPVLNVTTLPVNATVGDPISAAITATAGTPVTWSYTGTLPEGVTVASTDSTFTFGGTAGAVDTKTVTVTATNDVDSASATVNFTIVAEATPEELASADVGISDAELTAIRAAMGDQNIGSLARYVTAYDTIESATSADVGGDTVLWGNKSFSLQSANLPERLAFRVSLRASNQPLRLYKFKGGRTAAVVEVAAETADSNARFYDADGKRTTTPKTTTFVVAQFDGGATYEPVLATGRNGGSSSSGCDAGFGALALALVGLFGLKRK